MSIISNTSDIAMGAVLQQPIRGSITYFSNKLKPRETQYSTFDHELIGVCLAIQTSTISWKATCTFHVLTDHKPFPYVLYILLDFVLTVSPAGQKQSPAVTS